MPLVPVLALQPNIYLLAWVILMPLTYEVIGQFLCCQIWAPAQWPITLLALLLIATVFAVLRYFYQHFTKPNTNVQLSIEPKLPLTSTKPD